jgi:hypothetical protein
MSGTGVEEPDRLSVLTPTIAVAGLALAQPNAKLMLAGENAAVGVNAMTKLCDAP